MITTKAAPKLTEIPAGTRGARCADRAAITNAFRALAKKHHPDAGGDPDDFKRLRAAYDAALKEREE